MWEGSAPAARMVAQAFLPVVGNRTFHVSASASATSMNGRREGRNAPPLSHHHRQKCRATVGDQGPARITPSTWRLCWESRFSNTQHDSRAHLAGSFSDSTPSTTCRKTMPAESPSTRPDEHPPDSRACGDHARRRPHPAPRSPTASTPAVRTGLPFRQQQHVRCGSVQRKHPLIGESRLVSAVRPPPANCR